MPGFSSVIPHARILVVATFSASLLISGPAVAALPADPTADESPAPHSDEDGSSDDTPYVLDSEDPDGQPLPSEPGALVGGVPDPADIPSEWTTSLPATEITPSTPEQLTIPPSSEKGLRSTTAAVPAPPRKFLPRTLDAAPGWQATYSCDPNNKRGMVAFAEMISKHYNRPRYYTSRACEAGNTSQHGDGRAVDWPMNAYDSDDKAIGDAVAYWLTANNGEMARRFGIMSVIWNKRSWYQSYPGSWNDYTGPSTHTDHLHISFTWDGAMKRTSWWTGKAVTTSDRGTCRVYSGQYAPRYTGRNTRQCATNLPNAPYSKYPVTLPRARNNNVKVAQRYLGFTGTNVDGSFGPGTLAKLLGYQSTHKLPRTGVLDKATWAYMEKNASAVSRISGGDRYETAANVAALSPKGSDVYITTGENYPDALAAGARAGSREDPILLSRLNTLPTSTIKQLQRIKPRKIYIVGGKKAVASKVFRDLRAYAGTGGVTRLAGEDRYGTAAKVAAQFGSAPSVVYVATGANYPDALGAAARAGRSNAPVLLTRKGSIPSATRSALRGLQPDRIVVLGSTGVITGGVVTQLKRYATGGSVQRVSGNNRYETAAKLASYYPRGVNVVYLTTGDDFPDALAAAARGGTDSAPILLSGRYSLPDSTKAALADLRPKRIVFVGGTKVISGKVEDAVGRYVS